MVFYYYENKQISRFVSKNINDTNDPLYNFEYLQKLTKAYTFELNKINWDSPYKTTKKKNQKKQQKLNCI
jgi:hypothetical protein